MINNGMFTSKTDEWETPQDFFDEWNRQFHFTLDACANEKNHKCDKYYTKEDNGLLKDWGGEIVWCNPPYGKNISEWVKKCHIECQKKEQLLLPCYRQEQIRNGSMNMSIMKHSHILLKGD